MSRHTKIKRIKVTHLQEMKKAKNKLVMTTCYDSAFARLIDDSDIDLILVGDSAGNVVMGYDSTIPVTLDDMVRMTTAVTRGCSRPLVIADMPFLSYGIDVAETIRNAKRLIQEGGAQAVKVEGGLPVVEHVKRLTELGVPVVGHLGLTPQSIHALGGHKVQARSEAAADKLLADAKALQEAGVCCLVLELVPETIAKIVTAALDIPTIGIGAGRFCDGQVLVLHDMLGFDNSFKPKFLKQYANLGETISQALNEFSSEVKEGVYPAEDHSFK